jgi:histidinol-phosphate aminotransferase
VAALPAYKPGKSAEAAMREHDLASAIKLASNENPFDPLPSVADALHRAGAGVNRYPDHRATDVRAALAARFGRTPDEVAVGCGSVGLLQQLLLTYVDAGQPVVYGWRSFEAYPIYTQTVGGVAIQVPNRADETLDMNGITSATTAHTPLVLVTSPNNPTGTAVTHDELVTLMESVAPTTLVVLDEAYHEYLTSPIAPDALALQARYPNLAVLRTFSKAYGLAALRIGYLVAHPEVVAAVDRVLVPFCVNGLAQTAALASLEPAAEAELRNRVAQTLAERDRLVAELTKRDVPLADAQANFVWMPLGEPAIALTLALEERGVVTRPFAGEGVRVTIGTVAENDRFLAAFDEVWPALRP